MIKEESVKAYVRIRPYPAQPKQPDNSDERMVLEKSSDSTLTRLDSNKKESNYEFSKIKKREKAPNLTFSKK